MLKPEDFITSRVQQIDSRLPPVNMASTRVYLPSSPTVPVFPWSPYYGGYIRPEMSLPHQGKDTRLLPAYMSHCYHPAFQAIGIPFHAKDEEKPTQSYIGLISKAILSSPQQKLVLGDIYSYILTNYPYFKNKGPGWRNSVRHNLSLNDCFVKMGRSPKGKGHFWAINPINYDDFSRGEFKRKRAPRRNPESSTNAIGFMQTKEHDSKLKTEDKMHLYTGGNHTGLEKRGFHIENLLSDTRKR